MSNVIFDMVGKDDISELVRLRIAYMIDDFGTISEYERQCMEEQLPGYFDRRLGKELIAFAARAEGRLVADDVPVMTLQFYAPIYMLLTVCDREPEREQEALKLMEKHIRQFDKLYGRNF